MVKIDWKKRFEGEKSIFDVIVDIWQGFYSQIQPKIYKLYNFYQSLAGKQKMLFKNLLND